MIVRFPKGTLSTKHTFCSTNLCCVYNLKTDLVVKKSSRSEHHVLYCSWLREVDAWQESTLNNCPSHTRKPEGEVSVVFSHSASLVFLWGLTTPTLGLELEPGVSQCLGEVVIHRTCDGH